MAATKVKIALKSVAVHDDADMLGAGEWCFQCQVVRAPSGEVIPFGDTASVFEVNGGDTITPGWSVDLTMQSDDTQLEVRISGRDEDLVVDDDLGQVKAFLNTPIVHGYDLHLLSNKGNYTANITVEVLAQTDTTAGPVTTIVQNSNSSTYNSLYDEMLSKMVHICPVIPVPWGTGIPPIADGVQDLSCLAARESRHRPRRNQVQRAGQPVAHPRHRPGRSGLRGQVRPHPYHAVSPRGP